jgi:hypothetical protein
MPRKRNLKKLLHGNGKAGRPAIRVSCLKWRSEIFEGGRARFDLTPFLAKNYTTVEVAFFIV